MTYRINSNKSRLRKNTRKAPVFSRRLRRKELGESRKTYF